MAKTSKGIYYPYNYSEIADVPEDMKQMAESINKILEDKEVDETTQNTKIVDLQNKIAELEKENTELANNMPWNIVRGKNMHITDSAKYSKNRLEISGDIEQEKRSGKNKCPNTLVSGTSNGINYTVNTDGSIKLSGTSTAQTELKLYYDSTKPIIFKAGKYKNTSKLLIVLHGSTYYGINANSTITFSEDVSIYDIYFRINNGVTINETYYPQIINTSVTTDETYEQYGATPSIEFPSMPVVCTGKHKIDKCSENLIINNMSTKIINGVTLTKNEDETITVNGTATGLIQVNILNNTVSTSSAMPTAETNFILESGEYFFNGCSTGGSNLTYKLDIFKNGGTSIGIDYEKGLFFNLVESTSISHIRIVIYKGAVCNNIIFKPMLIKKEELYTINLGSTQICAIKDIDGNIVAKDRPVYRNSKWQWAKDIKKLVFNGTENWQKTTAYEGFYRYILEINDSDLIYANPTNIYGINSHFQQRINQNHGGYEYLYMQGVSRCGNIYIQVKNIDTVEKLKTFLAEQYSKNTPVTIYFVARNTTYIDCTAEQSTVLDKLYNNFELQKGINNVIVESEKGVGVDMELTYMQDNNLKDKKFEERITVLENLLSTTQTSALLLDNLQSDLESEVN